MDFDDPSNRKLLDQLSGAALRREMDQLSGAELRRTMDQLTGVDLQRSMAHLTGASIYGMLRTPELSQAVESQIRVAELAEYARQEAELLYGAGRGFRDQMLRDAELISQVGRGIGEQLRLARQAWEGISEGVAFRDIASNSIAQQMGTILAAYPTPKDFLGPQISAHDFALGRLEAFDWKRLSEAAYAATDLESLRASSAAIGHSYGELIRAVAAADPITMPPIVHDLPPLDIASHADFLSSLIHQEDEQSAEEDEHEAETQFLLEELRRRVHDQLEPRLERLNADFPKMWTGGAEALRGENPDRVRHFSISTRELITQVLHSLAPDERIREWSSESAHYDKGRPTRRARILYICREISAAPYADLVDDVVRGALAKMALLQKGTHGVNPSIAERQAAALQLSIGGDLLLLIESDPGD